MKLVYLWIESYQFIQKQGYLFHSGYEVSFDDKDKFWEVKKKENLDRLLYGNNISVTALVGDNGAGKSTILDIVRFMLFDEKRRRGINGFLVWEEEGNLEMIHSMEEKPYVIFKKEPVKNSLLPQNFKLIYYSDFLDLKYYLEDFDDGEDAYTYMEEVGESFRNRDSIQVNISTSYLLRKHNNKVMDYFHSDIKKQITYYCDLKEKKLPFSLPQNLSVKMEFLDIDIFDRVLDAPLDAYEYKGTGHHGEINTNAYVVELLKSLQRIYENKTIRNLQPINDKQVLQWDVLVTFIYNLLSERQDNKESKHYYGEVDFILKNLLGNGISEESIWEELQQIFESDIYFGEDFAIYKEFYNTLLNCIVTPKIGDFYVEFSLPETVMEMIMENNLWRYIKPNNIYSSLDESIMYFPKMYMDMNGWNGKWRFEEFVHVYDIYTKISYKIDFLKFSWGLSTGESNMFNLFARLYDGMKYEPKQKILLIFDELDSSFHPQWQQEIMMQLTSYLRSVYPETEFQILITTHSPVLLSDIPRENVIFLKKDKGLEKEHEQTFAANIASLYYDSFFMDKGSIGKIAKVSIGNLLSVVSAFDNIECKDNGKELILSRFLQRQFSYADRRDIEEYDYNEEIIQRLIDSIGEEIWRYKINEKYHQVLMTKEDILEREIKKELKILEKKKGRESVERLIKNWLQEEG